jgi:hypothetical protein
MDLCESWMMFSPTDPMRGERASWLGNPISPASSCDVHRQRGQPDDAPDRLTGGSPIAYRSIKTHVVDFPAQSRRIRSGRSDASPMARKSWRPTRATTGSCEDRVVKKTPVAAPRERLLMFRVVRYLPVARHGRARGTDLRAGVMADSVSKKLRQEADFRFGGTTSQGQLPATSGKTRSWPFAVLHRLPQCCRPSRHRSAKIWI